MLTILADVLMTATRHPKNDPRAGLSDAQMRDIGIDPASGRPVSPRWDAPSTWRGR